MFAFSGTKRRRDVVFRTSVKIRLVCHYKKFSSVNDQKKQWVLCINKSINWKEDVKQGQVASLRILQSHSLEMEQ